jgi:hypothetical protein
MGRSSSLAVYREERIVVLPEERPGGSRHRQRRRKHANALTYLKSGTLPASNMPEYRFTEYFEKEVLRKRPYIKKEWCRRVLEKPLRSEPQENNRYRFWGDIPELGGRYLRVVTLADKVTIHNAFPDRRFKL